jgi:L-asparaginase II
MPELVARVYRGKREEAVHYGSIAVVNREGKITHYLGDPEFFTFARSSPKPFQLMPLLQTGAADHFGFTPKQLAICCGSHIGTDEHRDVVLQNLKAGGNGPEHLQCGCHVPLYMQIKNIFPKHDEHKDFVRHNCSGKHSGFLALSRFLKEDVADYLKPDSKVQQLVLENIARIFEISKDDIVISVDGCSAPNFGMPMWRTALAFMKLANGIDDTPENREVLKRIKQAMTDFPEMFSGEGRFDLALMRALPGNIVCKVGAEAIEGIGLAEPSIGIAVKIHDGNQRALYPVCIEVLKQLGIIDQPEKVESFKGFVEPEIRNPMNILTGTIKAEFRLKKS